MIRPSKGNADKTLSLWELSEKNRKRFADVRDRAKRLGVLDISLDGAASAGILDCYERTLGIVEENRERFDRNAGETE
jgi:hypothetical protein